MVNNHNVSKDDLAVLIGGIVGRIIDKKENGSFIRKDRNGVYYTLDVYNESLAIINPNNNTIDIYKVTE